MFTAAVINRSEGPAEHNAIKSPVVLSWKFSCVADFAFGGTNGKLAAIRTTINRERIRLSFDKRAKPR
jgi:hypothetical protein